MIRLVPLSLLLAAGLTAGEARYARLGTLEGRPEIQLHAAEGWRPAVRNAPVLEGAWIRTGEGSRAEVELDEGSAFRLDAGGLCEFSDYTRLSTGQRITLISLDRGVAYFTGAAQGQDSLVLAVPGAQATIRSGARVRLEAGEDYGQIAVLEGAALFSSPAAELQIKEGALVRVNPANPARFHMYPEITALESDAWSEARDKALIPATAGQTAAPPFGLADLDAAGAWIETSTYGTVWKPKVPAGWVPFRNGKWVWHEGLGYTWVSAEPWGWLPYHYGRWALSETSGWVWAPGRDAVFSPGDVYWLRGAKVAGWGPLAPGEEWRGAGRPELFLNAHTTWGPFLPEAREIDPAGFTAPREPLAAASWTAALPSPAMAAAWLEAKRPVLRAGSTRVLPQLAGVTFGSAGTQAGAAEPAPVVNNMVIQPPAQPPVVVVMPPLEPPQEVYYPVPVYTGIVVMNPPEHGGEGRRRRPERREEREPEPAPAPAPAPVDRGEEARERREHRTPAPAPAPVDRSEQSREGREHRAAPAPTPAAPPAAKQIGRAHV